MIQTVNIKLAIQIENPYWGNKTKHTKKFPYNFEFQQNVIIKFKICFKFPGNHDKKENTVNHTLENIR